MLLSDYTAGTVTVSASGTAVTGVGTGFLTAGFQEGDEFIAAGWRGIVQSVNSNTSLTLYPTGVRGAALTGAGYRLRYQTDGSRLTAQARQLIELLGDSGNIEALAALIGGANLFPIFTGAGTMDTASLSAFFRGLMGQTTAAGVYGGLGVIPNNQLPERIRALGSSSTDANTIAENGAYVVAGTAANLPEAVAGVIEHLNISTNYSIQRFLRRATNIIYQRYSSFGTWGDWVRIQTSESLPYEEGSFTPGVAGVTSAGTPTYATQSGSYVKIGRLVMAYAYIVANTVTGITGQLMITGLPYAVRTSAVRRAMFIPSFWSGLTLAAGSTGWYGFGLDNNTNVRLFRQGLSNSTAPLVQTDVNTPLTIYGVTIYEAA